MFAFLSSLAAAAPSLILLYCLRCLDPVEREPFRFILLAFIFGIISAFAVIYAPNILSWFMASNSSSDYVIFFNRVIEAPLLEELSKFCFLVVLLFLIRKEVDSLVDFLVYSSVVALGFEFLENYYYQASALTDSTPLMTWLSVFGGRTIGTMGMHLLFSVWSGFSVWILSFYRSSIRIYLSILSLLVSVCLHGLNNYAAYLSRLGPPDQPIMVNHLGNLLYYANVNFAIIVFVALFASAVILDLTALNQFSFFVFSSGNLSSDSSKFKSLVFVSSPINQYLARSTFLWRFHPKGTSIKLRENLFRKFSKFSLRYAKNLFYKSDVSLNTRLLDLIVSEL